ncbi:Plasmalemma vesicle-associated protein MECA-32 antigen Plasmalemma vesicle protein 1 [Channa argus]|uniref:Plasmalemma vesicle-associated protein MECA-32 antigen Plasmalemma vesicle protein 1 n=1 Tax=Channa argus TaxID=215402 RepID=A0A6G1Q9S2_CHAAH|nr:Plasmalemma vesicle-associated protein MECA-32 antigen Plasmalemma vesicle protein 1 [Channa argus]
MYSSGYSQVNKYSPEAQRRMHRSKGKSCGYYMRIVFFFSSLIQSLIIVSLVLFLLYGKKEDSVSTTHIQDLETTFSQLSIENVALRQQRKNLTNLLNVTLTNKARNDWDLNRFRSVTNISEVVIKELDKKLHQCSIELNHCKFSPPCPSDCQVRQITHCNCGMLFEQQKAKLKLVETNFTETTRGIRIEMDQIAKERDSLTLEAIQLRREISIQEKELQFYRNKNKDDFSQSLNGVSNVSKAFLQKIDSLFPAHIAFQLTCSKQGEHLEQIRTNCTSLSREVEDKLQHYLNTVGNQVSDIQAENSRLKAENWRLSEDYRWCSYNRTGLIQEHRQNLKKLQEKHDADKEKLLLDKLKLNGEIEILENSVKLKSTEADYHKEQLRQLNMSCLSRTGASSSRGNLQPQSGWNLGTGVGSSSASSSISGGGGQPVRTGAFSFGSSAGSSVINKPVLAGTGTSSSSFSPGSSQSLSSPGLGLNKPGSSGGTFPSFGSAGSNRSLSSGVTGLNKPVITTRGSSTTGLTSNVKSPTGFGLPSGSSGSTGKTGSGTSSLSWFGLGSSNSGQSRTGSGTSSSSTGRTSGVSVGSVSVAQHLQDLNLILNPPPRDQDKQDISRILG